VFGTITQTGSEVDWEEQESNFLQCETFHFLCLHTN